MSARKRTGSGSKRQMKEKIVQIYECFFRGEDPQIGNPNFWDEFFLLKPKTSHLEWEIVQVNGEQLISLKGNINMLFAQCVETLGHQHHIRVVNALQTLCALIESVYKKMSGDYGFDVINILMGFETAEQQLHTLLEHCCTFLVGEYPDSLKALCLKLLLIMATGTDNVSQNTLLEYLMLSNVFEALIQLLCMSSSRSQHGQDSVLLLMLLVNYRKHEAVNPYVVKLSILDDELALNGLSQVITASLAEFCREFVIQQQEQSTGGWLSSLTSMVGNIFVSDDNYLRNEQLRANNAHLMALYEAVHLNRNFLTTLANTQTDTSGTPSPANTLPPGQMPPQDGSALDLIEEQPSNLLAIFMEYCSVVMQDTKYETSVSNVKLCFLILTCISEDQYANSLMHDNNLVCRVRIHKMPMRHRRVPAKQVPPTSCPLASSLLDLMVEFSVSHMMKKLPLELYMSCLGIVHRVLCYQKRCRVRLSYHWQHLWTALMSLLRFLLSNEVQLAKKMDVFILAQQVVNVFNLFITYGDTFLPSPSSYDELYYEMIRMHQVFDNLYSLALRYSTNEGEFKESALKLTHALVNIRAIVNHFSPKIDAWLTGQGLSTPTQEQILEVVRDNYDSLTLKLQDNLDQYDRYTEKPKYMPFFTSMVRSVISDTRQNIDYASLDQQMILQDFSSIS